jgi:hypothetical protein
MARAISAARKSKGDADDSTTLGDSTGEVVAPFYVAMSLMRECVSMPNLLEQAISSNDGERAAKSIQNALGIKADDVAKYCFPKTWLAGSRARIIGEWLQTKARFLAS